MLLILDLDETLIHASAEKLGEDFAFQVFGYYIYKRPGLDAFLAACVANFELAVWSSASDDYVAAVVQRLFPPEIALAFVWGRSRCTPISTIAAMDEFSNYNSHYFGHYEYAKLLKKVRQRGYSLNRVLIVDDTPHKVRNAYGNAIYPAPFLGDPEDRELEILAKFLLSLRDVENVRSLEKRQWQQRFR